MSQMIFNLPQINREATREKVEEVLDKYKIFLLMEPEELQPKITSTFTITPSSMNNQFHSSTEDVAVRRIDMDKQRSDFIKKVQRAVNRLSYEERALVINRYLKKDDIYDYEVYNDLGYSQRKFYRIKARAFYKLAFIMRIEVYQAEVSES